MKRSKIVRLDTAVREKLRELYKHQCQECGISIEGYNSQVSHGDSRKLHGVRHDFLNVLLLCGRDHARYSMRPSESQTFLTKHLGLAGYEELKRRSRTLIKTSWLDYDKIRAHIDTWKPGKYPDVSPKPLWEL